MKRLSTLECLKHKEGLTRLMPEDGDGFVSKPLKKLNQKMLLLNFIW